MTETATEDTSQQPDAELNRDSLNDNQLEVQDPGSPAPGAAAEDHSLHAHQHDGHDHDAAGHHDQEPGLHNAGHSHGPSLNPECTREIDVEVPAEEVGKAFRAVIKRYRKQARIPGFRAGKVPESLIRSKFAQEIRQDVLEGLVPDRFRNAIAAQQLKPVSQPQVVDMQLFEGEPLRFKAAFEVVPAFDIAGYDSIHVPRPQTALTDAEFDAEIERMRDSHATMETVDEDRPLADGDFAVIEFKGDVRTLEGIEGAEPAPQPVSGQDVQVEVGGRDTLDAFNAALRGSKPGQELQFEVAYPEDFGERTLAGKTVSYDVTIKGIKKKNLPELNDEFAREMGDYENYDAFSAQLRERGSDSKKSQLENAAKDHLVELMIAKFQFPVPESLVQQQIDARLDRGLRALAQQGMKAEDMRKLNFEQLRAAQRDTALDEVKASLILDKIAEAEGIEISDEDVDSQLMIISLQTREPFEALKTRFTQEGSDNRIREQLRREKTGNLLYEKLAT